MHPNQAQDGKKRLVEGAGDVFSRTALSGGTDAETVAALHAKIGQLTMENHFLESPIDGMDTALP